MNLPPYAELLGLSLDADVEGAPVLVMPFRGEVMGRPGFLHGGAISGLMEIAAIAALRQAIEAEGKDSAARIKPINVTIDFMRGGRDKDTRAIGLITRLGNRVANVDAIAWQDDRARPIARARMNYLLVRGEEAGR